MANRLNFLVKITFLLLYLFVTAQCGEGKIKDFEISIFPETPFVYPIDQQVDADTTYSKNWFLISFNATNNTSEYLTVAAIFIDVFDVNGNQIVETGFSPTSYNLTTAYIEVIPPGDTATLLKTTQAVDGIPDPSIPNQYTYRLKIRIEGWFGNGTTDPGERFSKVIFATTK
ncbi:MAG: hypothetical protein D6797_01120 [Bdellovibrio sp.]|nr:MAG: hypothetical protein D6797_01120 [Bdellovibrio sp.]